VACPTRFAYLPRPSGYNKRPAWLLHDGLLAVSPALERGLELGNRGPLVLLTGFQTPSRSGFFLIPSPK
jgi:hypothetical protein